MGQKVNPHGLRVGVVKNWDSKWYGDYDEDYYEVCDEERSESSALRIGVRQWTFHEPTVTKSAVAKNRVMSFNCFKVRLFIRAVMQIINERLVLPRKKLFA